MGLLCSSPRRASHLIEGRIQTPHRGLQGVTWLAPQLPFQYEGLSLRVPALRSGIPTVPWTRQASSWGAGGSFALAVPSTPQVT